jgi:putative transposase
MLRGLLAVQGCKIGRRHVKTLMRRMGIEALYRRPRTTRPEPGHKIYPYLLRGMEITRPNQVWAMDITYSAPRPEESGERMFGMQCERRKCEEPASCCEEA